ncbi:MAG: GNAT family N-acetyltransferase [Pyrinomonadaceae bacterium]
MENLLIRRAEPDDAPGFCEIYGGKNAYSGTLQLPFPSVESWRRRLAESPSQIMLVAVVDGTLVGSVGLHTYPERPRRKHVGTIGIGVRDDWAGKGIGTALLAAAIDLADNWLDLRRIELEVYTDNEAAIRLYEKFGFELEGTKRMDAFRDGRYVDSHVMARIKKS